MSNINHRVTWFEIPSKNIKKAKMFYENVFHITLKDSPATSGPMKMALFPEPDTTNLGIGGALVEGFGMTPSKEGIIIYFSCEDMNQVLERITKHGGKVLFPKTSIGEHGFVAHFLDSEGNRLGLHSRK